MRLRVQSTVLMLLLALPLQAEEPCHPLLSALTTGWLKVEKMTPLPVQTQVELAKQNLLKYPLTLPKKIHDRTLHALGMGKHQLMEKNPHLFNVLKTNSSRNIPEDVHSLAFTNSSYHYQDVLEVDYGLCMGHSTAQRKFNVLSFFDPKNKMAQQIPDKTQDLEGWYQFYEKKIEDLLKHNKPVVFPGFDNLKSLSSEERLQIRMKEIIVQTWADKNISIGGLKILSSVTKQPDAKTAKTLYETISTRLKYHYSPNIYLAAPNESKFKGGHWIHVMQAYEVSEMKTDGSFVVSLWDVNKKGRMARTKLTVSGTGEMLYDGRKLADVNQIPWDDHEMSEMVANLAKFCQDKPTLCPKQTP